MGKNKILISLDIGSSKIAAVFGDIDEKGDIHIIGFGEAPSKGIEKGLIVNPSEVIKSLREAIYIAEENSGYKVNSVIINIGGSHIEAKNEKDSIAFSTPNKEIDENDINSMIEKISAKYKNEHTNILHIMHKKYILDDDMVYEPIGLNASKITGEFSVITCKANNLNNLKKTIEALGISVLDIVENAIASSTAVLYEEEKEMGVALIDIGGGLSDIAIYKNGMLEFLKSIPIGGSLITKDIAYRFRIPKEKAENLKKDYGMASTEFIESNEAISLQVRDEEEHLNIERYEIVETIELRLTEIFEIIKSELVKSNLYERINAGIVLTGGVANTPEIQKLAEGIFGKSVRIGKTQGVRGFNENLYFPQYATSIGSLQFVASTLKDKFNGFEHNSNSLNFSDTFSKIFDKIKNLF